MIEADLVGLGSESAQHFQTARSQDETHQGLVATWLEVATRRLTDNLLRLGSPDFEVRAGRPGRAPVTELEFRAGRAAGRQQQGDLTGGAAT